MCVFKRIASFIVFWIRFASCISRALNFEYSTIHSSFMSDSRTKIVFTRKSKRKTTKIARFSGNLKRSSNGNIPTSVGVVINRSPPLSPFPYQHSRRISSYLFMIWNCTFIEKKNYLLFKRTFFIQSLSIRSFGDPSLLLCIKVFSYFWIFVRIACSLCSRIPWFRIFICSFFVTHTHDITSQLSFFQTSNVLNHQRRIIRDLFLNDQKKKLLITETFRSWIIQRT